MGNIPSLIILLLLAKSGSQCKSLDPQQQQQQRLQHNALPGYDFQDVTSAISSQEILAAVDAGVNQITESQIEDNIDNVTSIPSTLQKQQQEQEFENLTSTFLSRQPQLIQNRTLGSVLNINGTIISLQLPPDPAAVPLLQCHVRSCDQLVTGRNMSYARALEIVQKEAYLTVVDLAVIRRNKRDAHYYNDNFEEQEELYRQMTNQSLPEIPSTPTVVPPPSQLGPSPVTVAGTLSLMGIAAAVLFLQPISPPAAGASPQSPPPQPGQFGGGQPPLGNSPVVLTALSLVPAGLQAVAVFPPYATPRTFDAISVIFSENTGTTQKRRLGYSKRKKASGRGLKWHKRIMYSIGNVFRMANKGFKKLFTVRKQRHSRPPVSVSQGESGLFGFRTMVRLVQNQPCTLEVTCDIRGNKIKIDQEIAADSIFARQSGEEFQSNAPPECRTELNPDGCV